MQISDSRSRVLAFDFGTGGLTVGLFNPHDNRMEGFGGAATAISLASPIQAGKNKTRATGSPRSLPR